MAEDHVPLLQLIQTDVVLAPSAEDQEPETQFKHDVTPEADDQVPMMHFRQNADEVAAVVVE